MIIPAKWEKNIPKFDGDFDTPHVTSFLEFFSGFNVIHEDALISIFVNSLELGSRSWIRTFCRSKQISFLVGLIQEFVKRWDHHYEKEKYERIIEDCMVSLHKDEKAPHDPMED
jgi:hypothetical protein